MPALPVIESAHLDVLDNATYWTLMERERRLADWALEQEAILVELCH